MDYSQKRMFEKNGNRILNQINNMQYQNIPNHHQYNMGSNYPNMLQIEPLDGFIRDIDNMADHNNNNYIDELNPIYRDNIGINYGLRAQGALNYQHNTPFSNLLPMTAHFKNVYRPPESIKQDVLDNELRREMPKPNFIRTENDTTKRSLENLSEVQSVHSNKSVVDRHKNNNKSQKIPVVQNRAPAPINNMPDMNLILTLKLLDPNLKIVN